MAYGNEIVLGFLYEKWPIVEEGLGFSMPRPRPGDQYGFDEYEAGYFDEMSEIQALSTYWDGLSVPVEDVVAAAHDSCKTQLVKSWRDACTGMGWQVKRSDKRYYKVSTSDGPRRMAAWGLKFYYDTSNLADTPELGVIGIGISSRYYPTFLDWENPHGTIYNQVVGPRMPQEMTIARACIVENLPCFDKADFIVREVHY